MEKVKTKSHVPSPTVSAARQLMDMKKHLNLCLINIPNSRTNRETLLPTDNKAPARFQAA